MFKNRALLFLSPLLLAVLFLVSLFAIKNNLSVVNDRIAFGFLGSNFAGIVISIIIIIIIAFLFISKHIPHTAVILIIIGALSNLLDRIVFGGAIDYLPLFWGIKFNLADIFITFGFFITFFKLLEQTYSHGRIDKN